MPDLIYRYDSEPLAHVSTALRSACDHAGPSESTAARYKRVKDFIQHYEYARPD